jgi:hypothetical protein
MSRPLTESHSVDYDLVYSLPRNLYTQRALLALLGIPLFLVGRALWRRIEAPDIWAWVGQVLVSCLLQAMGVLTALFFFGIPTVQGAYLEARLLRGHYAQVEGTIEEFTPGDGHVDEQWTVVGPGTRRTYSYNPYGMTPGFDRIHSEGGPIRPGLRVRVVDVDGYIARLEIAQPQP